MARDNVGRVSVVFMEDKPQGSLWLFYVALCVSGAGALLIVFLAVTGHGAWS